MTVLLKDWEVTFDKQAHEYRDATGKIPGVSELIKRAGKSKSFYSTDSTKRDRGTRIHEATELMDTIGLSPLDFDEADIHPHLTAWNNWQHEGAIKILQVEKLVGHKPYRYAGTLDRVVETPFGVMVADLKTGAVAHWHRLQLAAYAVAIEWLTGELPAGGIAVYTKDTGKYTTKMLTGGDWEMAILDWKSIARGITNE